MRPRGSPGSTDRLPAYRGRFAPSPTGPLHLGSLVAALASFLEARARGGQWRVRIEDLDPPREAPGAADAILRALEACGLRWDGPVLYQSRRTERYGQALAELAAAGAVFPCACTRAEVRERGRPGAVGTIYPGTCRNGVPPGRAGRALRVRVHDAAPRFVDAIQGPRRQRLASAVGDYIVRRADGLFAYALAVVVDDAAQGITHVVRGADLLPLTPAQIHLQGLLGLPTPAYAHVPVAVDARGEKLGKRTGAAAVDPARPGPALGHALALLGLPPPAGLAAAPPAELLAWARPRWALARVPRAPAVQADPRAAG